MAHCVDRRLRLRCDCCSADHCRPAPWVENAVATLSPANRTVNITCLTGYRFPDGDNSKVLQCYADGHWDYIPNCGSTYLSGNLHLVVIRNSAPVTREKNFPFAEATPHWLGVYASYGLSL